MSEKTLIEADAKDGEEPTTPEPTGDPEDGGEDQTSKTSEEGEGGESKDQSAAEEPPEQYSIEAPEGTEIDAGLLEQVTPILKEHGFSNAKAQELAGILFARDQAAAQAAQAAHQEQVDGWRTAVEADKTLDLPAAQLAVKTFGSKGLIEILNSTGLGNHPDVVRCFADIGKRLAEDSSEGATTSPAKLSRDEVLRKRYPSMYPN